MQTVIYGTTNYKVLTNDSVFWEYDFNQAKLIYDNLRNKKKSVRLIVEQWEGEIGGDGVFSEDIIFESTL